jgi:biopolymer transport protein ExbD
LGASSETVGPAGVSEGEMIARRPNRSNSEDQDASLQWGMIPILNCMFLLIPALLLATEAARMAGLHVTPPRTHAASSNTSDPPALRVKVHIREDAWVARVQSSPEEIIARNDGDGLDELEQWAKRLSAHSSSTTRVEITADAHIALRTLVDTMDALRGRNCDLRRVEYGESADNDCYLWEVTVNGA